MHRSVTQKYLNFVFCQHKKVAVIMSKAGFHCVFFSTFVTLRKCKVSYVVSRSFKKCRTHSVLHTVLHTHTYIHL